MLGLFGYEPWKMMTMPPLDVIGVILSNVCDLSSPKNKRCHAEISQNGHTLANILALSSRVIS